MYTPFFIGLVILSHIFHYETSLFFDLEQNQKSLCLLSTYQMLQALHIQLII